MELFDAIYNRRSVRKFLEKDVEEIKLKKIIDCAIQAPSACDIQGWKFIIIKDQKVKQRIVDQGAASFIKDAPAGILVTYNNQTEDPEYLDYFQSAAAAIQNMILAAYSFNIGCCWVCYLPTKKQLRKILNIPHNYDPIAYIAMGYKSKEPSQRPRRYKVEQLVSYNKFKFNEKTPGKINPKLSFKRFLRKIYYMLPFRKNIKLIVDKKFEKKFD